MDIIIVSSVFSHDWVLKFGNKRFYLGQDVKFCSRVLGMDTSYVAEQIGGSDLTDPRLRKKLAKFICHELNITKDNVNQYNLWDFCAQ
jgi:hypothetical protein